MSGDLLLVAALLVGHCIGDFTPLSTPRMLESKQTGEPRGILAHALVHAALVGIIVFVVARPDAGTLANAVSIQGITHLAIDMGRALAGVRWPRLADMNDRAFWYALGVDQLAHGLVLVLIASVVSAGL